MLLRLSRRPRSSFSPYALFLLSFSSPLLDARRYEIKEAEAEEMRKTKENEEIQEEKKR